MLNENIFPTPGGAIVFVESLGVSFRFSDRHWSCFVVSLSLPSSILV